MPPKDALEIPLVAPPTDDQELNKQVAANHEKMVRSYKAKFDQNKKWYDRLADMITENFGTLGFLVLHAVIFATWIVLNAGLVPNFTPFDPYPFGFLTMVVSLEAIFLAIIVQISINRQSIIADLRQEIDFNINVRAESEITKILNIVDQIHDHLGMENENDEELMAMKLTTNIEEIENDIENEYKVKR